MKPRNRRRRSGFTLIELLLVAGILALLAAFIVPNLMGTANQTKEKLTEAMIGRNGPLGQALERYKFDMGKYPDTDEGLAVLFLPKEKSKDDPRYKGPYIDGPFERMKDSWVQPLEYRCPGEVNQDGYDLWSKGIDQKDDGGKEGSDDIKNWIEK